MAAGNKNLNSAKTARKDEFYTQLTDIEKEMRYYRMMFFGIRFPNIALCPIIMQVRCQCLNSMEESWRHVLVEDN